MFNRKPKIKPETNLDAALNALLYEMENEPSDTEKYATLQKRFIELYPSVKIQEEIKTKFRISPDAALAAGANIFGIALILHHEKAYVIASKAVSFIPKLAR